MFGIGYHCGVRSEIRFAVRRVKAFEWQSLTAIRVEPWSYASSLFWDGAFLFLLGNFGLNIFWVDYEFMRIFQPPLMVRVAKCRHGSEWQSGGLSEPWRDRAAARRGTACGGRDKHWCVRNRSLSPPSLMRHLPLIQPRGGLESLCKFFNMKSWNFALEIDAVDLCCYQPPLKWFKGRGTACGGGDKDKWKNKFDFSWCDVGIAPWNKMWHINLFAF